jgi:hypothetical protein
MLGLQSDFAMLGRSSAGGCEYWLGKVCRLVAVYSKGRKVEWRKPIDLQNLPAPPCQVHVRAQWYERREAPAREGAMYTLTDLSDYSLYHVKYVIMPLQLNLCKERDDGAGAAGSAVFKLHDTDKRALDQHVKDMMFQMNLLDDKKREKRVRMQRKEQVPADAIGGEAEGLFRVEGRTSRAGRKTTTIVQL